MARLSSPGSGEGLPLQLEPPATVACSDSALSGVVATGPTWLSSQIGIMQLGNWILLLLTFSYFNLNSRGGYLDSSALQTLLSHQAGQGPSRCVPFILHLYSSRPLAAPTSRKSLFLPHAPVRASLSYTSASVLPTCPQRCPGRPGLGLAFGV